MPEKDLGLPRKGETGPNAAYFGSSSVNYAATGAERTKLWTGGGIPGANLELWQGGPSKYPLNQVNHTKSGHAIEIDDTDENARVLIRHKDGSGLELSGDGSVLFTSKENLVQISGSDHTVFVEGSGKLIYKGDLDIDVTGDLNINCLNFNVTTKNGLTQNIGGSLRSTVAGNFGTTVTGAYSVNVNSQATYTMLGGLTNNVKGDFNNNVNGTATFLTSGNFDISSEGVLNANGSNMNIAASNLSVIGSSGVIGGPSINFSGNDAEFDGSLQAAGVTSTANMTADYFIGKLQGTAKVHSNALDTTWTYPSQTTDTPSFTKPAAGTISAWLALKIKKVAIDVGDFIKSSFDKSADTDGIMTTTPTTEQARSKMRDPANKANQKFVSHAMASGAVHPSFRNPAPKGIGRIVNFDDTTPGRDSKPIRKVKAQIIPEKKYDPTQQVDITSGTLLARGIPMSKFLGTGDPVSLTAIRDKNVKVEIARYYYLHAQIMKTVMDDKDQWENYRLVVSEGLYLPGPNETITPGSINDLKSKGRAVVYKLYDQTGTPSVTQIFNLANWWKDQINYDKMILDYDTIDKGKLDVSIILIMPELDGEWNATYTRTIETHHNGEKLSNGELTEVLPFPRKSKVTGIEPVTMEGLQNGRLPMSILTRLPNGGLLRHDAAAAWMKMEADAKAQGVILSAGSTYRTYERQKEIWDSSKRPLSTRANWVATPGGSKHGWGIAVDESTIYRKKENCPQYRWLIKNGLRYGWARALTNEAWHWEYIYGANTRAEYAWDGKTKRPLPPEYRR